MNDSIARSSARSVPLLSLAALAAAMATLNACSAMQPKAVSEPDPAPAAQAAAESAQSSGVDTPVAPAQAPGGRAGAAGAASTTGTAAGTSAAASGDAASARKAPSAPAPQADAEIARGPGNSFVFDPRKLRWYAYDGKGKLVRSGRASGGKSYCPDIKRSCRTPAGRYTVYRKGGPGCKSSKFPIPKGGAPMPYCMFFRGGYAIHGGQVPGHNASHGCIRVPRSDAQWLHRNFVEHGTTVIVRGY